MKNISVFFICTLFYFSAKAQSLAPEVISANGGHSASSSGSVSWTIGEPVSDTYNNSHILTKGFHQPRTLLLNSIKDETSGGSVYTYPNPVLNDLTIDFSSMQAGIYHLEIFDAAGKIIEEHTMNVNANSLKEKIEMYNYADGLYLFKITSTSVGGLKLFRVTKQK